MFNFIELVTEEKSLLDVEVRSQKRRRSGRKSLSTTCFSCQLLAFIIINGKGNQEMRYREFRNLNDIYIAQIVLTRSILYEFIKH